MAAPSGVNWTESGCRAMWKGTFPCSTNSHAAGEESYGIRMSVRVAGCGFCAESASAATAPPATKEAPFQDSSFYAEKITKTQRHKGRTKRLKNFVKSLCLRAFVIFYSKRVVLKYFSARSGKMVTIFPVDMARAIYMAPARALPLEIPPKMPSSRASRLA